MPEISSLLKEERKRQVASLSLPLKENHEQATKKISSLGCLKETEDYVPHAVSTVVGKKYLVLARVTQDIYRQDNVLFRVSSVEAIDTPTPAPLAAANDDQRHIVQQNSAEDPAKDASTLSEGDSASVVIPPRDVIEEFGSGAEEDTTSTSEKRKRKSRTVAPPGPKNQVFKNLHGK